MAELDPVVGSEQGGTRPVAIIQNDMGNLHSPTVIAVPLTGSTGKPALPTHVPVSYTHLDVYKRQAPAAPEPTARAPSWRLRCARSSTAPM